MKETILTALSLCLTILFVSVGLLLSVYFFSNKLGFLTFISGAIGYSLVLRPAVNEWEQRFKKWLKIEK